MKLGLILNKLHSKRNAQNDSGCEVARNGSLYSILLKIYIAEEYV